jgi:hypothetical protein
MQATLPAGASLTRASSGTRVNSSGTMVTETTNVARFTYNPVTLALRGLLNEPSRTNLALFSEDLANGSGWGNNHVTVTSNSLTAPDGNVTGDLITANVAGSAAQHQPYMFPNPSVTNSTVFTSSGYIQAGTTNYGVIGLYCAGATQVINIDCSSGSIVDSFNNGATSTATRVDAAGSNWYRGVVTGASSSSGASCFPGPALYNASSFAGSNDTYGTPVWTAAGTETLGGWGFQVEVGSDASSYIVTTSAAATRAADVLTLTVPNGTYMVIIDRESGPTTLTGVSVTGGTGYAVPTDTSPLQSVVFI